MNYQERRNLDIKKTDMVSKFIDENIYSKLKLNIKRVYDRELQLRCVDLIWEGLYVDEKIAINYINRNLKTFSFELSSLNNKNGNGWFLKQEYILTDYYLIGYLEGDIFKNSYTKIELLLIQKDKIWEYLNYNNFKIGIINSIRAGILEPTKTSDKGADTYYINIPGVKIVHSKQFSESPINVVINKEILYKLCSKKIIYKNNELYVN